MQRHGATHVLGRFFTRDEIAQVERLGLKYIDVVTEIRPMFAMLPMITVVDALKLATSYYFDPPYAVTNILEKNVEFSPTNTCSTKRRRDRTLVENDFIVVATAEVQNILKSIWDRDVLNKLLRVARYPFNELSGRDVNYIWWAAEDVTFNFIKVMRHIYPELANESFDISSVMSWKIPYEAMCETIEDRYLDLFQHVEIENISQHGQDVPISQRLRQRLEFLAEADSYIARFFSRLNELNLV